MVSATGAASKLESILAAGLVPSLADLGGVSAIVGQADELVASPLFDELVRIVAGEWDGVSRTATATDLARMICDGLARNTRPVCLADAIDVLLAQPSLSRYVAKEAAATLISRALADRHTHPLVAAYALEGALRFAVEGLVSRHHVLAAFEDLSGTEPDLFASRVARLLGVAVDLWRDEGTVAALRRLLNARGSEDEVAFEIGIATLSFALDAGDRDSLLRELGEARCWFARAERAAEGRLDAVAYGAAVDAVLNFGSSRSDAETTRAVHTLNSALADETWVFGHERPSWLRPRATATAAWGTLALELTDVSTRLQRDSWLDALRILARVVEAYRCCRRVRRAGELAPLLEPAIEAAFVSRQGLLAHLDDFLAGSDDGGIDRAAAVRLRARIRPTAEPPLGKA